MPKFLKDKSTFFCFSPPVMLATFIIEIILAFYVWIKYGFTKFGRVAVSLLLALAVFQVAEYQICTGASYTELWPKIGFVAITLLPILGLYLVSLVSHKTHFLKIGYGIALFYLLYFLFIPKAIDGAFCGGNYVIFNSSQALYSFYGFYYWIFLILGIWEALEHMSVVKKQKKTRGLLFWIVIGYLSFMLPMGALYLILPSVRIAMTSVMCGFAVIFAFILALVIVPKYHASHRRAGYELGSNLEAKK